VAQRVVDQLEPVEVEQDYGDMLAAGTGVDDRALEVPVGCYVALLR